MLQKEYGRLRSRRQVLAGAAVSATLAALPATGRAAGEPIKIGVVSTMSLVDGVPIPRSVKMAADAINAKGGVLGRSLETVFYDDHKSTSEAVRVFQRLVSNDKVSAVIGTATSETALALLPWSARLRIPFIVSAAASDKIPEQVHGDYERFKYVFVPWLISFYQAKVVADSARGLLVDELHMKSCVIMAEDAAWTTPFVTALLKLLPEAGLKVLGHTRFATDTTDYAPIFTQIAAKKPDVIITAFSRVGVLPVVQWAARKMPIPMYGVCSEAGSSGFWKETHGAAEGAVSFTAAGPDSAITRLTLPFAAAYAQQYGSHPPYGGYSSYDGMFIIADAIKRARSLEADRLVDALEKTDQVGVMGRLKFYGREEQFTHAIKYGPDLVPGVMVQWHDAKIKTIWPLKVATVKIAFAPFVHLPG